jgi:hypothetical protein
MEDLLAPAHFLSGERQLRAPITATVNTAGRALTKGSNDKPPAINRPNSGIKK